MDAAIKDGKVAQLAANIDGSQAKQVVDAKGLYVVPGIIDLHAHVFFGTQPDHYLSDGLVAVVPDGFTFRGCYNSGGCRRRRLEIFPTFKKNIIDNSQTRVLSLLNIVGEGMRGGAYEQNINDMDPRWRPLLQRRIKILL